MSDRTVYWKFGAGTVTGVSELAGAVAAFATLLATPESCPASLANAAALS